MQIEQDMVMMCEEFENRKTGEVVKGVTIILEGPLQQVIDLIQFRHGQYGDERAVLRDALQLGLQRLLKT